MAVNWLIQAKRVAVGLLLIICIPHVHCVIYSRAQLNIWWVCWQDPNSMTARILGAVVEFTVGCVVIIVVFVLNLVQSTSYVLQGPLSKAFPSVASFTHYIP